MKKFGKLKQKQQSYLSTHEEKLIEESKENLCIICREEKPEEQLLCLANVNLSNIWNIKLSKKD